MTLFLRLTNEPDKAKALGAALAGDAPHLRFSLDSESFTQIPGAPFAYLVDSKIHAIFANLEQFETNARQARVGDHPGDSFKFIRLWWEADSNKPVNHWKPYNKGGSYSAYYSDIHLVVDWDSERQSYRNFYGRPGRSSERPSNFEFFFRPGITWPLRTQKGLNLRIMPQGCIFSHKGPSAFVKGNEPEELLTNLAITNSAPFRGLVGLQMAFGSYEVGVIQRTPVPPLQSKDQKLLAAAAISIWTLKQSMDQAKETSHVFLLPALVMSQGPTLANRAEAWMQTLQSSENDIQRLQAEIDILCWDLYGIAEADRRALAEPGVAAAEYGEGDESEGEEDTTTTISPRDLAADLASWLFGAAMGRWDWGLATVDNIIPPLPGPFDPLPRVSRGMRKGSDGLHPARNDGGYLLPPHDLLVDDDGSNLDLISRSLEVLARVVGEEHIEARTQELENMLGSDLRTWFRTSFFDRHLKQYSKSRRKAPIYWQLGTASGSYSLWLYYPRLTRDSLYRALQEVVNPKVGFEEQRLTEMRGEGATSRQIEAQEGFVEELRSFREEVARVAPLWNPDLDDGVLLNFAPLWRLTPHAGWRRDTKVAWDSLARGEFDWAKLAMKLWPERVVPKCARERHLALAHDLEAALVGTQMSELVQRATSPAVKDALQSLLSAPAPGGGVRAQRSAAPRRAAAVNVAAPSVMPATRPVTLGGAGVPEEMFDSIKATLAHFPQGASRSQVVDGASLPDGAWTAAIQILLDRGEVERQGERRGTRYFLK
jgi:hypothetical protein